MNQITVAAALVFGIAGGATAQGTAGKPAAATALVFEYRYEFNSDALNENHYIVLDSAGGRLRGWYYGTSDDFDSAREGYLPGFFVAEMQELVLDGGRISFSLSRPELFFATPVPLTYRSVASIPAGTLKPWTLSVPKAVRAYAGEVLPGRIVLQVDRRTRVFLQRAGPQNLNPGPTAQSAARLHHAPVPDAQRP